LLVGKKTFLRRDTDVHHKNGNSLDNRYKNLEAIPHNEHAKKHYEENREYYQNNSFEDAREWGLPDYDNVDISSTKEAKKVEDNQSNLVGKENFRKGSKPICVKDKAKLTIGDLVRFKFDSRGDIGKIIEIILQGKLTALKVRFLSGIEDYFYPEQLTLRHRATSYNSRAWRY
jgi:sRNA-binding protein